MNSHAKVSDVVLVGIVGSYLPIKKQIENMAGKQVSQGRAPGFYTQAAPETSPSQVATSHHSHGKAKRESVGGTKIAPKLTKAYNLVFLKATAPRGPKGTLENQRFYQQLSEALGGL